MPKDFQNIQGGTRGDAADFVLDFRAKPFKPGGKDFERMHNKWFKFILKSKTPLLAKLALFWHDHFSVGFTKVQDIKLMAGYVQLLHTYAKGNFKDFVKAMNKNPAMMEYLDTVRNDDDVPNENYARELQELFTLGVKDFAIAAAEQLHAGRHRPDRARVHRLALRRPRQRVPGRRAHDYDADFPRAARR